MSVLELDFSVRAASVELEAGWQRGTSRSRPPLPTNQARQDGSPAEAEGKPQSGAASMGPATTNRALSPLGSVVLVLYGPPHARLGGQCAHLTSDTPISGTETRPPGAENASYTTFCPITPENICKLIIGLTTLLLFVSFLHASLSLMERPVTFGFSVNPNSFRNDALKWNGNWVFSHCFAKVESLLTTDNYLVSPLRIHSLCTLTDTG